MIAPFFLLALQFRLIYGFKFSFTPGRFTGFGSLRSPVCPQIKEERSGGEQDQRAD